MAVTNVKILKAGPGGDAVGQEAGGVTRNFTVVYQATCDNENDGPNTIINYFEENGPWIGEAYQVGNDQRPTALLRRISPARTPNSAIFNVTLTYEEPGPGSISGSEPEKVKLDFKSANPLFWHDQIEKDVTYITIPVREAKFHGFFRAGSGESVTNNWLKDGYRGAVVNSALDPYDPEPEAEIPVQVLRITRNVFPWNDALSESFTNSVNDGAVLINKPDYGFVKTINPYCGRIIGITGSFEVDLEYKQRYWRTTIEVHIHPITWRLHIPDKGLRRRAKSGDTTDTGVELTGDTVSTTGPQVTHIRDAAGNYITTPVLFDGNGKPLTSATDPVLGRWEVYREISWDGIPW